ncbi:MAG: hypothetical protein NW206_09170 [Hyphomonadaceae bacterium]|nr:hypothetical protein [Hyphomonadaceae bacterium]
MSLSERTAEIQRTFTNRGLKVLGAVWASRRAIDFALRGPTSENSVVRCTNSPLKADSLELKTMLAEGDFTRAFIVYTAEDQPHLSGEIETYPLSRIDELAALLAKESAP